MAVDLSYFGLGGKEDDFGLSYIYDLFRVRAGILECSFFVRSRITFITKYNNAVSAFLYHSSYIRSLYCKCNL